MLWFAGTGITSQTVPGDASSPSKPARSTTLPDAKPGTGQARGKQAETFAFLPETPPIRQSPPLFSWVTKSGIDESDG